MKKFKKLMAVLLAIVLLVSALPMVSAAAYGEYSQLVLGEIIDLTLVDTWYVRTMEYTPDESGYYRLYSLGYSDTYVECYDENGEFICSDDDSGVDCNFNCTMYLQAGDTYVFDIGAYELYSEVIFVCFEKLDDKSFTEMTQGEEYEVTLDGSGESQWYSFTPDSDGYYAFYSEYFENSDDLLYDDDPYGIVYDSDWNIRNKNDDAGYEVNFCVEAYLFEGETYYLEATDYYQFGKDNYTVKVEETAVVEEINVAQMPYDTTCYKGYIGQTLDLSGLVLELVYSDGSVAELAIDDYEDIFGLEIDYGWYLDEMDDAYMEVWTTFASTQFDINDIENPVESIKIKSMPEITLIENVDGYYNDYYEAFIYDYYIPYDTMLEVTYTDGSKETVNFYDGINGYSIDYYDMQGELGEWEVGENYVTVEYFDVSTELPVNVIENPVESVVLDSAPTAQYEFGDWEYGYYDEETGEYYLFPLNLEGIEITVNYTDGTSESYDYSDFDVEEGTLNGFSFSVGRMVISKPGVYETSFYYMGYEGYYDITVVGTENPPVLGDVDGDGEVTVLDATAIQKHIANLITLDDIQCQFADVDKDGNVTVLDASLIQKLVANIIEEF